jgi:acid phosphatase type 7
MILRIYRNVGLFCLLILVSGQIYSSEFLPTSIPDRVVLTMKTDPSTSMAVNWRTDTTVRVGIAEISLVTDLAPANVQRFTANFSDLEYAGTVSRFHKVNFVNLDPGAAYMYRVGNDSGPWSEWHHFRVASNDNSPFSFIYLGDLQTEIQSLGSRVVRAAFQACPDAAFILHAGDLINGRGDTNKEWGEWHHAGGFINAMTPSISTPGNHDHYSPLSDLHDQLNPFWNAGFSLPRNGPDGYEGSVYFLDYQGVRVVSLNSQAMRGSEESARVQAAWLDEVLSENPRTWTVVTFHHPVFSTVVNRDNQILREFILPILEKHGVDLVLQGHEHTYNRGTNPLVGKKSAKWRTPPVHVVSYSGPKSRDLNTENAWWEKSYTFAQLYQVINVSPQGLEMKTFTISGKLVDHFRIERRANGLKRVVNLD